MAEEKKGFDVKALMGTVKGTVTDKKFLIGAGSGAGVVLLGALIKGAVSKKGSNKKN